MIKVNELKGKIVSSGLTQEKVAKQLGITSKTFGEKLKKGVFLSSEIEMMVKILEIDNLIDIFFAKEVSC